MPALRRPQSLAQAFGALAMCRVRSPGIGHGDDDFAGHAAAANYSLIGNAKLNGVNAEVYLRPVLERIAGPHINRVEDLLPWNVATTLCTQPAAAHS